MIIGIDASKATIKNRTGVENLTYQLILNLNDIDQTNQYHLYTPNPLQDKLKSKTNFKEVLLQPNRLWNKVRLPLELIKNKPDVFLMPSYMVPSFAPDKTAVIFHDLAYKIFPRAYSSKEIFLQELAAKRAVKKSRKIIFVSESAKKDFCHHYHFSTKKSVVIHLGYDANIYKPNSAPKDILNLQSPYILYVGRLEARKNVTSLISAFYQFKNNHKSQHKLVLVGKPGFGYQEILEAVNLNPTHKQDVVFPGYVEDSKMNDLYTRADLFVFPSLYEGFGIPVLEAFACMVPVITSNVSALPEVAGDAAILIDPNDVNAIATSIARVLNDDKLKKSMISKGLDQAENFTWSKFAREVLSVLENL